MTVRTWLDFLAMFALSAALGALFCVFGPVAFVRLLGLVAFIAGAAGCAVQIYAMHEFAPAVYVALRRRARVHLRRARAVLASAPALAAWHQKAIAASR